MPTKQQQETALGRAVYARAQEEFRASNALEIKKMKSRLRHLRGVLAFIGQTLDPSADYAKSELAADTKRAARKT